MDKKYIDNFTILLVKLKEYEVFAFTLLITMFKTNVCWKWTVFKTKYDLLHSHISVLASLYF